MEYRCGLVATLPGIEPGKTFRAVCSTRIALGPLGLRSRFYEPRLIYGHVSQRGEADLNGLQWERIKPTRFLPPGIPGTRPGGNSLLFQSGSHDNRAPCKEAGVGRLILINRNYIAEMLNDGIRTQIGKGHF